MKTCINCKLPIFDPPVGLATPQCKCMWTQNTPPTMKPWVGLTDEEVSRIENEYTAYRQIPEGSVREFARAIEAKLKEKNRG